MTDIPSEVQRISDIELFTRFALSPWGAAKGEVWESMTDFPFTNGTVLNLITRLANGSWRLSQTHRHLMEMVLA